ncbi:MULTISPECIES: hypothetical protein [Citrobacter]|uniref:hypothetical protein n=1 Tax=Citrobacter TaxID=544 RepID=UPI002574C6A5|nr:MULTISPECIES: hypothetical protein [Citrobacter]MDM3127290.1 hypothetical protein [Citrobacter sp. CK204]WOI93089.1 hypothetical protein R1016_15525 [Citrobacter koseri]
MIGKYFDIYLLCFIALSCFSVFSLNRLLKLNSENGLCNHKEYDYKGFLYILIAFILICFYSTYIAMIPLWEDFTYQDSNIFWRTLKDGHQHYGKPIWYNSGRFFPLGHQEFEVISKVSASNFAYHLFAIFEMVAIFFISLKMFGKKTGIVFFVLLTITGAFVQSFFGLIYPERNMALLLMLSFLFLNFAIESKNIFNLTVAIIFFSLFLFYKETAFLITLGISASLMLSYLLNKDNKIKMAASISLAFISVLWVASYSIDIYPAIEKAYGNPNRDFPRALISLINSPWLYTSLISFFLFLFKQRNSPYILLPIVSIGYSFTMYYMNFPMPYYHLPSVLISIFCIFTNAVNFNNKVSWFIIFLLTVYTILTSSSSIDIIKDRKESVFAKSDALEFIFKNNHLDGNKNIKVSFNNIDPWTVHILSGSFTNKYKVDMKGKVGGDCKDVNYAIYFQKKPEAKDFYTSESVPMWNSKYKLYVVKCK